MDLRDEINKTIEKANMRYHTDAQFHFEVDMIAIGVMGDMFFRDPVPREIAYVACRRSAMVALQLKDDRFGQE